jgi:lipid-A-disaccharide synthase
MNKILRIGILAGESSGDILGAGLMSAIKRQHPAVRFEGIGGELMTEQGLDSMVPMERLSVMGLIEPLKRLGELLRIRKRVLQHFLSNPPALFIGIDSPDFNLGLEQQLKAAGIKTVHYVSPSVWAWRQKRVKKIKKAVDLILTLFPFEAKFYQAHGIAVLFVGHPLADIIPMHSDSAEARRLLGLPTDKTLLAMLPGSRSSEVSRLAPEFLACAARCQKKWPNMQFAIPCANAERYQELDALLKTNFPSLPVKLFQGHSRQVVAAADCLLIASGTATLEALLLKKPMIVCYKMASLSFAVISRMLKVPYFSLPNLLAGKKLVAEKVQEDVDGDSLYRDLKKLLENREAQESLNQEFKQIHQQLQQSANEKAAQAVLELIHAI